MIDVQCLIISLIGVILFVLLVQFNIFIGVFVMFLFSFLGGFFSSSIDKREVIITIFGMFVISFIIGGIVAVFIELGFSPDLILGLIAGMLEGIVFGIFAGILGTFGVKIRRSIKWSGKKRFLS